MTKRIVPSGSRLIPDNAKKVFSGVMFDVYQWQQEMFDGSYQTFEMLRRPDSVFIIGITNDNRIVTISEEQPGGIRRDFTIPAGHVDDYDETIEDAAKRELCEETGYQFEKWKLVKIVQPEAKMEWFVYTFVATGEMGRVPVNLDVGEKIEASLSSLDEAKGHSGPEMRVFDEVSSVDELRDLPEIADEVLVGPVDA